MSYSPPRFGRARNMQAAILTATQQLVNSAPKQCVILSQSLSVTGVSIVSGRLRLSSGASYVLEGSPAGIAVAARSSAMRAEVAWINTTTGLEIGTRCIYDIGSNGTIATAERTGRWSAQALILASDFGGNATMDIELRVMSVHANNVWYIPFSAGVPPEGSTSISVWRVA